MLVVSEMVEWLDLLEMISSMAVSASLKRCSAFTPLIATSIFKQMSLFNESRTLVNTSAVSLLILFKFSTSLSSGSKTTLAPQVLDLVLVEDLLPKVNMSQI